MRILSIQKFQENFVIANRIFNQSPPHDIKFIRLYWHLLTPFGQIPVWPSDSTPLAAGLDPQPTHTWMCFKHNRHRIFCPWFRAWITAVFLISQWDRILFIHQQLMWTQKIFIPKRIAVISRHLFLECDAKREEKGNLDPYIFISSEYIWWDGKHFRSCLLNCALVHLLMYIYFVRFCSN